MSNSKRTIAADLESPFLDQQIVGPDPTPEATDYLESGEDEGTLDEEEQAEDSEAESAEEMEAFWRAESGTTEEAERDDAESEDEEPEISEACEEEQENSDEGAEAEWEDLEDTADEAAAFEPELLDSEVWSGTADQNAFRDRVLAAHIARSKAAGGAPQRDLRRDELKAIPRTSIETRADTADAAGRLLAAANADLAAAQKAGDADARRTVRLTATSGYRSSAYQSDLWRQYLLRAGRLLRPHARRPSGHSRRPPLRRGCCLPAEAEEGRRVRPRRADCRSRLQQSSGRHCGRLLPGPYEGESHRQQVGRRLPATVAQHLVPQVVEDQRCDVRLCADLDRRVALGVPPVGDIRCPSTGRALHTGPACPGDALACGYAIRRARALRTTRAQRHRG